MLWGATFPIALEPIQMWEVTLSWPLACKLWSHQEINNNYHHHHHIAASTALYAVVAFRKFVYSKVEEETHTVLEELRLLHPAACVGLC